MLSSTNPQQRDIKLGKGQTVVYIGCRSKGEHEPKPDIHYMISKSDTPHKIICTLWYSNNLTHYNWFSFYLLGWNKMSKILGCLSHLIPMFYFSCLIYDLVFSLCGWSQLIQSGSL